MMGHLHASAPRDFDSVSEYFSAILDNAGKVEGVLVVRVAVEEFWSLLPNVLDILVLDENGVRIADSTMTPRIFAAIAPLSNESMVRVLGEKRYGAEIVQIPVSPLPVLASQLKANNTFISFPDSSGNSMRAALRKVGTNPWTVVAMIREDAILATINETFWQAFGLGVLVTLGIGSLTYFAWRAPQTL
jgi:C4-dicarboxylate-specific signal transduction histidine kinase